ncbi:Lrp/AsnC family transcriptional regulator [Candidatus Pacearchaeota archaeon]|nr:Lrp/AsnC family transcriptional regulator [Candidatus Pacearchaeota archaeon]
MIKTTKFKLDKYDGKLLFELDKDSQIASTTLAKRVGRSRQAVEYRINRLVKEGIITGFQTSINPHKLGYKIYKTYFKLRNIPNEKQKLLEHLRKAGIVYWMGECSGSWDLIVALFVKDDYEFFNFKNELTSKFTSLIVGEDEQIILDAKQYPKRYFTEKNSEPVIFAGKIVQNEISDLDFKILSHIVNNSRISIVELSSKVKANIKTVNSRLEILEKKGIILQYRIGIDLNKLGLELYKAIITLDRYTPEDEKKLFSYVSNIPNINYFIRNLGQIELEFVAENYQEYYKIIEDLKKEFPNVIRTADFVLMITDEWTPGFENLWKTSKY